MRDNQIWSTSIGRWCGIPVRAHLFLFLFVAVMFGHEWNVGYPNSNFFAGTAMVTVAALLVAIVLHELAHVFAAASIGGRTDEVVLMPWGGNSEMVLPNQGYAALVAHFAGPFVNGMLFLLGLTLLVQTQYASLAQLINPFRPHRFNPSDWQVSVVEIFTWVNFQLMAVNLIPCFPFDGARIVRTLIEGSGIDRPRYWIETAIRLIGNATAFGMIFLAGILFYRSYEPGNIQPGWLYVSLGGITLLFAAKYSMFQETADADEEWREFDELEYSSLYETDSSLYLDAASESENLAYSQWLIEKQESRLEAQRLQEQEEDERADAILEKLHANGGNLGCLTDEERMILDRFSERIRKRRQQSV